LSFGGMFRGLSAGIVFLVRNGVVPSLRIN
jgi:hypothetical protein